MTQKTQVPDVVMASSMYYDVTYTVQYHDQKGQITLNTKFAALCPLSRAACTVAPAPTLMASPANTIRPPIGVDNISPLFVGAPANGLQ